ncbi:MAG: ACT domain-containing protein, partial [Planctomycetota bacterium]|nr:ACT domain-containing protein [Planctomycetota bacterium]
DMIVQNIGEDGKADISFTVLSDDLPSTTGAVGSAIDELGAGQFEVGETVAKVSVVGMGMARQTGVADRMFRALADADVNILMITTSEIKISALVERDQALDALRAVHSAFELEKAPESTQSTGDTAMRVKNSDALDVVTRLAGMEDLMIDEVALDDSQARITISQIPDEPGVAAKTFENIAEADIFVDMIIQSFGHGGRANLSFTVPRDELDRAAEVATSLAEQFGCGEVTSSPQVAKLSVSGVGLRSHVGVAIRMFKALADAAINVEMINTSEVRVNVVVDGAHGQRGLECLQTAFADVLLC